MVRKETSAVTSRDQKPCLLCAGDRFSLFERVKDHGEELSYWACRSCCLVFMSPRPDRKRLETFYSREYWRLHGNSSAPTPAILNKQEKRAAYLSAWLKDFVGNERPQRHLDIGCSAGRLMVGVSSVLGCRSVGVEPFIGYRAFDAEQGLEVYSSIEEIDLSVGKFDLITMSHVLEHLEDPLAHLTLLHRNFLTENGLLLIQVPSLYGHPCFEIAHNFAFIPSTLRAVLSRAGFVIEFERVHSSDPTMAGNSNITVIARRAAGPGSRVTTTGSNVLAVKLRRRMMQISNSRSLRYPKAVLRLTRRIFARA